MRIITVANQKGGCGKTTVVINLGACLAREGQRTLAVDLDPQGHCALGLAVPEEQIEYSVSDLLMVGEDQPAPDPSRATWQISSNFDLIPSRMDLGSLEQKLAGVPNREKRLRRALETLSDKYDFILVDSPPTVGFMTQSAIYAADEVVVPVDTGYFSLHGLSKQLDTLRELRDSWGRTIALRILANLYDVRTKLGREILAELRKRHGDAMYTSFVNFNTKLKESTSVGQPITEYDPASSGCKDFMRLARELIAQEGKPAFSTPAYSPTASASLSPAGFGAFESRASMPAVAPPMTSFAPATAEAFSAPVSVSRSPRSIAASVEPSLMDRADALAEDANRLLATTQALLGPGRGHRGAMAHSAVTPQSTERKIELIYGPRAVEEGLLFTVAAPGAYSVRLAGDFNDWNPDRSPMHRIAQDVYQVRLPLSPGRYRYRYVIDGRWHRDPANDRVEINPFGELNSVVEFASLPIGT